MSMPMDSVMSLWRPVLAVISAAFSCGTLCDLLEKVVVVVEPRPQYRASKTTQTVAAAMCNRSTSPSTSTASMMAEGTKTADTKAQEDSVPQILEQRRNTRKPSSSDNESSPANSQNLKILQRHKLQETKYFKRLRITRSRF